MFSKFKVFRKAEPTNEQEDLTSQAVLENSADVPVDFAEGDTENGLSDAPSTALTPATESAESEDRMRRDIETAQSFLSDRARFGIGMLCNSLNPPVVLKGFVDFNHYDVKSENPSFWKLNTQSGVMFGQLQGDVVSVYPARSDKNAPFEDSKLGRGLASFGGSQFQPEMAKSRPDMTPAGTLPVARIDEALAFCNAHHVAVAIAILARKLPQQAQCEFVSMRRLQTLENGSKRLSLGVRLGNSTGVIRPYRILLDAEKAVLVENENKVVSSIRSDEIRAAAALYGTG